jgi:hypothetical protein
MSRTQDTSTTGVLTVSNSTQSTTKDNGALVVEGGVGVEKNLNVGGDVGVLGSLDIGANLTVAGNLTVEGALTSIETNNTVIEDKNIELNFGGDDTSAQGAGLTVNRTGTPGSLVYDSTVASRFKAGDQGSESEIATMAGTQIFTGAKTFGGQLYINHNFTSAITTDNTTTGASANIALGTARIHKLTNASLTSVSGMDFVAGKELILINATGAAIDILNDVGSPAAEGILTGTGSDLTVQNDATLYMMYDDGSSRWRIVGGSGGAGAVGFQEIPAGTVNGVNTTFGPLTYEPIDEESIIVFVDSLIEDKANWSLSSNQIVFSSAPAFGQKVYVWYMTGGTPIVPPAPSGSLKTEYITLDNTDVTNKYVTLAQTPASAADVLLDIIGGSSQQYTLDFVVTGSQLGWNGLGLDGVLANGDVLRVHYIY